MTFISEHKQITIRQYLDDLECFFCDLYHFLKTSVIIYDIGGQEMLSCLDMILCHGQAFHKTL